MKLVFALIIIATFALSLVSQHEGQRKFETGAWSSPVHGLRGRLLATRGSDFVGTRMIDVYLELENVSDVANPMEIYFDDFRSLKSRVVNGEGRPLNEPPTAASIASPGPYWLVVPSDGTLRFRVSLSGYGIYKNSGTDIPMASGNWVIAPADKKAYFIEGDFTAAHTTDRRRAWQGTLHLPPVSIPH